MNNEQKEENYYAYKAIDVIALLNSSEQGLSQKISKKRLLENGFNEFSSAKMDSYTLIFLHQFKSPLIYILLGCGIIVFLMGEIIDAGVIFFVLIFNSIVGTIQEGKAQSTFLALKKIIKGKALVLRDGIEMIISDREIVVGDIIILREGDKVPADARIIEANILKVNESVLTGESISKFKIPNLISEKNVSILKQDNMLFSGTTIVSGNAKAIVTAIGEKTFLGSIAKETLNIDGEFPLKNDIIKLSKWVIIFVFFVSIFLFIFGHFLHLSIVDTFKIVIAISVSVIPEGLPIVMTLVLAGGVWRMGKKNVLVKKMQAVEVLGEIGVLAVDKTGTITKNELFIQEVYIADKIFKVTGSGYEPYGDIILKEVIIDPLNHKELLLAGKIAALSSSANIFYEKNKNIWKISGDPTDASMIVFSQKIGFHKDDLLSEMKIISELPFDYELKLHLSLYSDVKNNFLIATGSPEAILNISETEFIEGKDKKISEKRKRELHSILNEMSEKGLRVIGFAYKNTNISNIEKNKIPKLVFGGFLGIKDTLRNEVKLAVKQAEAAGIRVVMITGDYEITAKSIATDAGIYKKGNIILSGDKIDNLSDKNLSLIVEDVSIFVRVAPQHKLRIIKAYQDRGIIVAMTGDGVNDALSLTAANIGIGMGKIGTEVAKEASDIILLDDNFGNISYGVYEGRNIFITIKKVILYLFSTSVGEVFVVLGSLIVGMPMPILAVQILWMNLITDGFLDVSLAMEPRDENPEKISGRNFIIDKDMLKRIFFMAIPMAIGTLILFSFNYENNISKAWTISLTVLAVFQWFNAWNCRHETESIFQKNIFSNKYLILATVVVVLLQFVAIYNSFMQKILKTVPLNIKDWAILLAVASSIIIIEEIRKLIKRKKLLNKC